MKIVSVVGARPQFVKAAILRRLFDGEPGIDEVLVHTGQHFDAAMSDVFFDELEIRKPEYALDIHGGTHGAMTGRMLEAMDGVLSTEAPDACLVYGDTNSTLAGALSAAKMHIPVIHVEAGLRSFNRRMPEELNRILTDHVSELLFCSTHTSVTNLENEGITSGVHHVGDIMYDAVLHMQKKTAGVRDIQGVDISQGPIVTTTLHRAENTDDKQRLSGLLGFLNGLAETHRVILPLHPRTRNAIERFDLSLGKITTIEPVGYRDMQALLTACELVVTDSGGVQKEAYFHGKPCITMRDETEWVELIEHGWNRLWTQDDYKPRKPIDEYGRGHTGEDILSVLKSHFGI